MFIAILCVASINHDNIWYFQLMSHLHTIVVYVFILAVEFLLKNELLGAHALNKCLGELIEVEA